MVPGEKPAITVFHSLRCPPITIEAYVKRLAKYTRSSAACFALAFIYIERLYQATGVAPAPLNVHRLLLAALVLATKYLDDRVYCNAHYGRVGGVSNEEVNRIERELAALLDYRLFVSGADLSFYLQQMRSGMFGAAAPVVDHDREGVCITKKRRSGTVVTADDGWPHHHSRRLSLDGAGAKTTDKLLRASANAARGAAVERRKTVGD